VLTFTDLYHFVQRKPVTLGGISLGETGSLHSLLKRVLFSGGSTGEVGS